MPSAFSPSFPLSEESFMKSCYYLVLALLFITILAAPASAQDMMPVQFIIRDENNQPMTEVSVYIYTTTGAMPPTPGPLYAKITIDSGDYWTLPYGKYLCKPTKTGYVSRFPTEDNRINEGQTVCYLYMDVESGSEPEIGQPVTLRAIDESSDLIPGVTFKIYRCTSSPPYSPIELVRSEYSASGQLYINDLPKDYYCVEVSKTGYSQRYATGENRFANHDYSPTLNIVMDNEFPPVTLQAIDGTTESLLPGVYFKIYYCDPVTFEQGDLVKTTSVTTTGEIVVEGLSRGHYCFEAVKDGYSPRYPASEWRFQTVTDPPSSVVCIMDPEEEVTEPNQPVEFQPYDINGHIPLDGVEITVYTCDPATFEPGDIVDTFTVDYGEIRSLPRGHYCIEASYINYNQVYTISETRFSNLDGPAVALIPMQYIGVEDGTVEVRIVDVDTEEPLQNVRLRIYEALPNFQQGRLVTEVTVNSGDHISLPSGRYFAQATKSGYTQYFDVTNTRVTVDPPSPSILYIPMTSRDGIDPGEGSFLDQSIEGIANLFGVSFGIGKTILGMLLALGIGTATAKHLRGGAQEFGMGMLGGVVLGVLAGLLPIWVLVLLVLIVGLWIGQRYMSGGDS